MPKDISNQIQQWQGAHDVALSPDAYAALLKMASISMAAAPYRLTMRSGVAPCNDNPIGDFFDEKTANLVGSLIKALDEDNAPEYSGFDVQSTSPAPARSSGRRP